MSDIVVEVLDDSAASAVVTGGSSSSSQSIEIEVHSDSVVHTVTVQEFIEISEQGPTGAPGTGGGGESVITVHPDYAGLSMFFGPGPLPEASTMPNTVYIVLPPLS